MTELSTKFYDRVLKAQDGHWYWMLYLNPDGYGRCSVRKRNGEFAHRVAWELEYGTIPDGMVMDHLCKVRSCVNPAHLEVVTPAENQRRSWLGRKKDLLSVCRRGHDDWVWRGIQTAQRVCRTCANATGRRYKARQHVQESTDV